MKKIFFILFILNNLSVKSQDRLYPMDSSGTEILHGFNATPGLGNHSPVPDFDRFNHPNGAMYFDGNDYLQITDTSGMNGAQFSISAWIKYPSLALALKYWFCYGTLGVSDEAGGMG